MRGVPLRLEIGPKDIEKGQVMLARRDTRAKLPSPLDGLGARIVSLLDEIQQGLFQRAVDFRTEHTSRAENWDEFLAAMEGRPGFVIARWCGDAECEARIKAETQATIRNLPFEQVPGGVCVRCDKPAITEARFAKAY
jgi:prolyl-tRNA synthetase